MYGKMIDGSTTSSFQSSSSQAMQMYGLADNNDGAGSSSGLDAHSSSLLYKLSVLKDKVYQVQTLVSNVIVNNPNSHHQPGPMSMANVSTMIQEIVVTASSMMFTCQQMMSIDNPNLGQTDDPCGHNLQSTNRVVTTKPQAVNGIMNQENHHKSNQVGEEKQAQQQVYFGGESLEWFGDDHHHGYSNSNSNFDAAIDVPKMNKEFPSREVAVTRTGRTTGGKHSTTTDDLDCNIIELNAADLLAKYTHYCQICGKGFKRDANLRMHMRAHGDEYKSSAALSNPIKNNNTHGFGNGSAGNSSSLLDGNNNPTSIVKYSCPQEGCKWNKKHAKFQPLKSMICVKNHFKRSHCPKVYVCKRCNQKQFSVLSDLRTHEKHCGDLKWQCSCGTTFSRKDKLMGHVSLFVGHTPVAIDQTSSRSQPGNFQEQTHQSDNR